MTRVFDTAMAVCALMLGSCTVTMPGSATATTASAVWPDACSALPGYADFRRTLERAVAARDTAAFRALFQPKGSMRIGNVGSHINTPAWGFDTPDGAAAWAELDEILRYGCAARDGKAILPAMAELVEDNLDPSFDMAITDLVVRKSAAETAPALRRIKRGGLVQVTTYDNPQGWVEVWIGGKPGFVKSGELRSPHSYQMVLVSVDGRWFIREVGSGV